MIEHWNFQELLYMDRIFKIYMIFKFSEFVIRSLFSAGGPYRITTSIYCPIFIIKSLHDTLHATLYYDYAHFLHIVLIY